MNIALIVEGDGDHRAFPTLIAKTGAVVGEVHFANNPIKAGTAEKLAQEGKLEAALRLAASRAGAELVLVAVDLDDGCPVAYHADFERRAKALQTSGELGIPVRFCFCIREYEAWFLASLEALRLGAPEFDWIEAYTCDDPTAKRDAKGEICRAMERHYKPSSHQLILTRAMDLKTLYASSRSYRKFVKSVLGVEYDLIEPYFLN